MMGANNNCRCICRCSIIAVIVAAILGVIAVFLQFAGLITVPTVLLSATFIIAVAYLLVLAAAWVLLRGAVKRNCLCSAVYTLLAGIAGTALIAALLMITGIAGGVFGSILIGLLVFIFTLIIGGTICLIAKETDCDV